MNFADFEKCFNRAVLFCFVRKKIFLTFPLLVLCGILLLFFRALAFNASGWIAMSLVFLSILLASALLLSLGVLLIRLYYHEVKSLKIHLTKILRASRDLILGTAYLSIPSVLIYLLLWILLGIFLLLREIPSIGNFFGTILSFGPFLLILGFLVLVIFNWLLLFFVAPALALSSLDRTDLAQSVFARLKKNIFSNLIFFFLGCIPILITVGFLTLAAVLTSFSYLVTKHPLSIGLQWFFIMLPFCAFLTPAVVFFFNFAAEAYYILAKKES